MIDQAQAKKLLASLPWPPGKKPLLNATSPAVDVHIAQLYDPKQKTVVTGRGPTPEGALRAALFLWIGPKGKALEGDAFVAAVAVANRLAN